MSEKVIRPSHYGGPDASCDPLSVMEGMDVAGYASLAEAFAHANVLKLAWRVGKKAGEEESDREKLAFYALTLAFGRDAAEEGIRAARESMPEVTPQVSILSRPVDRERQARKEKTRPPAPDVAAPAPKAVTEAPAEPVPEAPRAPSPPEASLTLPPRPEPEMPRVAQAIEIRQRERRESVRLDRAFSNVRAVIETGGFGWVVVCRYQKNGLGRWEEIGDGVGMPAPAGSNLARRLG